MGEWRTVRTLPLTHSPILPFSHPAAQYPHGTRCAEYFQLEFEQRWHSTRSFLTFATQSGCVVGS